MAESKSNQPVPNLGVKLALEERLKLQLGQRRPDQVTELRLDSCKGPNSLEGLLDGFVNLRELSLMGSGLTSLKGFPKLPNLKILELNDNAISGGLEILKGCCEQLGALNLTGNRIKDLSTLQELKELPNLKVLDLCSNAVASVEDYRNKVFQLLPQLNVLDEIDRNGKEYVESDEDDADEVESDEDVADDVEEDDDEEEEEEDIILYAKLNPKKGAVAGAEAEESDSGDDDDSEEEIGLKAIYNDNLDDDDSGSDLYDGEEQEEEDDDISEEDGDDDDGRRGTKRKLEGGEEQP